jgi:hypothetical protein
MITLYTFLGLVGLTVLLFLFIRLFYNIKDGKLKSITTSIFGLLMLMVIMILYPMVDVVFDNDEVFQLAHSRLGYMFCGTLVIMFELTWLGILHSTCTLTRKV